MKPAKVAAPRATRKSREEIAKKDALMAEWMKLLTDGSTFAVLAYAEAA